jgi:hypothetical protein
MFRETLGELLMRLPESEIVAEKENSRPRTTWPRDIRVEVERLALELGIARPICGVGRRACEHEQ